MLSEDKIIEVFATYLWDAAVNGIEVQGVENLPAWFWCKWGAYATGHADGPEVQLRKLGRDLVAGKDKSVS